ncbi:MAG: single-stranded DNA-binding protein [Synechococcaceae cyanobacterium SM2_3_1]|nr:single-stranded DNA-binding protein [Synechococcaceae cyanobacterium SM2_3_1]
MSLNMVNLVGRAGTDPEVRYFESGKVKCNFPLAVDRRRKGEDKPDWFNIEIWGRTAEIAGEYVRKGSLIGIQGSLRFDHWKDKNTGEDWQKPVISVDRLDLLGSRQDRETNMPEADMDF